MLGRSLSGNCGLCFEFDLYSGLRDVSLRRSQEVRFYFSKASMKSPVRPLSFKYRVVICLTLERIDYTHSFQFILYYEMCR